MTEVEVPNERTRLPLRLRRLVIVRPDEYGCYLAAFGAIARRSPLELAEVIATAEGDDRRLAAVSIAAVDGAGDRTPDPKTPSELAAELARLVG